MSDQSAATQERLCAIVREWLHESIRLREPQFTRELKSECRARKVSYRFVLRQLAAQIVAMQLDSHDIQRLFDDAARLRVLCDDIFKAATNVPR